MKVVLKSLVREYFPLVVKLNRFSTVLTYKYKCTNIEKWIISFRNARNNI